MSDSHTRFVLAMLLLIGGCSPPPDRVNGPVVLTSMQQLDQHVGQTVTVRGGVSNSKIPNILGVEVKSDDPDLRGKIAEATGVLSRYMVTPEQLKGMDMAHQGAGVFYRLMQIGSSDRIAAVRPVLP